MIESSVCARSPTAPDLLTLKTVLRDGFVNIHVGAQRDLLLSIRRGEMPWEAVNALRLHTEFDGALNFTRLPERPDYARANAFLLKARRAMVDGGNEL